MTRPLILPLHSKDAPLDAVGGKGANLALLYNSGFPVPDGFMITTAAYHEYVETNNLRAQILSRLVDLSANEPGAFQGVSTEDEITIHASLLIHRGRPARYVFHRSAGNLP